MKRKHLNLRAKMLIPLFSIFFASFLGFGFFIAMNQWSIRNAAFAQDSANQTELIAQTIASYVWNLDLPGLERSLESFLKQREIVSIEVLGNKGDSLAKVDEPGKPKMTVREAEISYDGSGIGTLKLVFTDSSMRADINGLILQITVLGFLIFAAMAAAAILIANLVTTPVLQMMGVMRDLAEGEGDLSTRIPVKGGDEVAKLATYFNAFIGKLSGIVVAMKGVASKAQGIGDNLETNSSEVSSASEEISATMESMSKRTDDLSEEIRRSDESVAGINSFIEEVVRMIQDQAAAVNQSSAAIEEMIANVLNIERSTETKMEVARRLEDMSARCDEDMKRNVNAMERIAVSTDIIAQTMQVIDSVASQTNLLAMNAAIEAAHAGEFGRGFSVVADEIRKLAEQTAGNSKSISSSLKEIISGIDDASGITRKSSETISEVIRGIADVANGMSETMAGLKEISTGNRQITESLQILNKMTEDVKNSGRDMQEGTSAIKGAFASIRRIADENRNGIQEISAGINQISMSMTRLAELSNQNSGNIIGIEREMSKFKT